MIPDFDRNAAFIWACYAVGAVPILLAILLTVLQARAARRRLAGLTDEDSEGAAQ
jgi:heme exporter protein CcmD